MKALITRKMGMTSIIADDGKVEPLTLLAVEHNYVMGLKTIDSDGYNAVRVAEGLAKKISKPLQGQLQKDQAAPKLIREFRISDQEEIKVGEELKVDIFNVGDKVTATGTSLGKGWAGTIKRHNFHRGRKTHGGRSYRRVGSIGSMYPQHILKGKKMAGRMGHEQVSVKGLAVKLVDVDHQTIGVSGSVPGPLKSVVIIREEK